MDDLFGVMSLEEKKKKNLGSPSVAEPQMVLDLTAQDAHRREALQIAISRAKGIMDFSANLSQTCFQIADYVPHNIEENKEKAEFWKVKVLPSIKGALTDDIKARNELTRALSNIQILGGAIHDYYKVVLQHKGSPDSIALAKKQISEKLRKIKESKDAFLGLQNQAIDIFGQQADTILQIAGPEAANYTKARQSIEEVIQMIKAPRQALLEKIYETEKKVNALIYIIHVYSTRVEGAQAAIAETKRRTERLMEQSNNIKEAVRSIPATKRVNTVRRHHYGLFGWWYMDRTYTEEIQNDDRDSQKAYYESILAARVTELQKAESNVDTANEIKTKLEADLCKFKGELAAEQRKLGDLNTQLNEAIRKEQAELQVQEQKMKELEESLSSLEKTVGSKGAVLIDTLTAIKSLPKATKGVAGTYAPIAALLEEVYNLVEPPLMALSLADSNPALAFQNLFHMAYWGGFILASQKALRELEGAAQVHNVAITIHEAKTKLAITQTQTP